SYRYTISRQADLYEWLARRLDIGEAHIFSHDYGDTVAQELLARHERTFTIKSVCLLNGGLFPESYHPRVIQRLLMSPIGALVSKLSTKRRLKKTFQNIFGPDTQPTDREIDHYWYLMTYNGGKAVIHRTIRYMKERSENADRWVRAIRQTRTPLRLIDGTHDPISGKQLVDRYRSLVNNPDVIALEGIGHYPHIEAPQMVLRHYFDFINNQSS
ncbi:MAG: alpha/beta hydrolase, partial [Cyclobacteriaceae bacterium]